MAASSLALREQIQHRLSLEPCARRVLEPSMRLEAANDNRRRRTPADAAYDRMVFMLGAMVLFIALTWLAGG